MLGRRKEGQPTDIFPAKGGFEVSMNEQTATVLSADTHFKGTLAYEKSLKIEGSFEGEISTPGTLHVGKDAKVKAEIRGGTVHIEGSVTGNVTATDKVELCSTAKLAGDVKSAKLVVEEGATLVGHCEVSLKAVEKESSTKGVPSATKIPLETFSSK